PCFRGYSFYTLLFTFVPWNGSILSDGLITYDNMKKIFIILMVAVSFISAAHAQKLNLGKAVGAASKGVSALTFTNEDAVKLAKDAVEWMDANNEVAGPEDPYTKRLERLFGKHQAQDGLTLNYKV